MACTSTHAATAPQPHEACTEDGRVLEYGFYSDFKPVSYSEDSTPGTPGFNRHRGYEAGLLTALESMADAGLSLNRTAIDVWPDIWLQPAGPRFDFVGGGITILDSRTRNAAGETAIVFTSGHVAFRQSLLVRAEDADRLSTYESLHDARVAFSAAPPANTACWCSPAWSMPMATWPPVRWCISMEGPR